MSLSTQKKNASESLYIGYISKGNFWRLKKLNKPDYIVGTLLLHMPAITLIEYAVQVFN